MVKINVSDVNNILVRIVVNFFKRSVELLRGEFSMKQNSREFISESLPIF